jgi:hypothetical protein
VNKRKSKRLPKVPPTNEFTDVNSVPLALVSETEQRRPSDSAPIGGDRDKAIVARTRSRVDLNGAIFLPGNVDREKLDDKVSDDDCVHITMNRFRMFGVTTEYIDAKESEGIAASITPKPSKRSRRKR